MNNGGRLCGCTGQLHEFILEEIHGELKDAARTDGTSDVRYFLCTLLPVSTPWPATALSAQTFRFLFNGIELLERI